MSLYCFDIFITEASSSHYLQIFLLNSVKLIPATLFGHNCHEIDYEISTKCLTYVKNSSFTPDETNVPSELLAFPVQMLEPKEQSQGIPLVVALTSDFTVRMKPGKKYLKVFW